MTRIAGIKQVFLLLSIQLIFVDCWTTICPHLTTSWLVHRQSHPLQQTEGSDDLIPLKNLLLLSEKFQVDRLSATDLAYIGDGVYELFIRSRTASDLQLEVVAFVGGKINSSL
jgi:hypothetical protein